MIKIQMKNLIKMAETELNDLNLENEKMKKN